MDKATAKAMERLLPDEPAKANYFLDRGFPDLATTARAALRAVRSRIASHFSNAADRLKSDPDGILMRLLLSSLDIVGGVSIALFGTATVVVIALLHAAALAIGAAPAALAVAAVGGAESLRMKRDGIAGMCPVCKTPFTLPGYRCPSCGAIHYRLRPGRYGILHHTCSCGQKLPSTRFGSAVPTGGGAPFKRADLKAVCTNPALPHDIEGAEARTVCIPLAGGRSTGKTAFMNAIAYTLTERIAPDRGLSAVCLPGAAAALHRAALDDYATGEVSMTLESTDLAAPTSTPLSFRLHGGSLEPDRIVHVVDTPGEAFVANTEHERQLQYGAAAGVVLMIDPMSIPAVGDVRRRLLGMVDSAGVGNEDPNRVLAALIAKMQDAAGIPAGEKLSVPLAIVLSKIDQAGLAPFFDADAARAVAARPLPRPRRHPRCAVPRVSRRQRHGQLPEHGRRAFRNRTLLRLQRHRPRTRSGPLCAAGRDGAHRLDPRAGGRPALPGALPGRRPHRGGGMTRRRRTASVPLRSDPGDRAPTAARRPTRTRLAATGGRPCGSPSPSPRRLAAPPLSL